MFRFGYEKRIAFVVIAACLLSGCVVQQDVHFKIAPQLENPREVQLGGMVTDQLIALWEENDRDAAETLEALRALTSEVPIVIENPLAGEKTTQALWEEAIQPIKRGSFNAAMRAVSLRVSDRALCFRLIGPIDERRVANWKWCRRDFLGEPVKHTDQIENGMPRIVVASDRAKLAYADTNETFVVWGFDGPPLEDYVPKDDTDWDGLAESYAEMKLLGANVVRLHLQVGDYMDSPTRPNQEALRSLRRIIRIAESEGLYLDITGLACFDPEVIPRWYDRLSERRRWDTQAVFWAAIARTCSSSNAIMCYDLMNEPVLDGGTDSEVSPWLVGDAFGGKYYFVQRLVRDLRGRDPVAVRKAWVDKMVASIRQHDPSTLVTVGVIPWPIAFGGGSPSFYNNTVDENLDFVSVHVYPKEEDADPAEMDKLIEGLEKYDYGKPLIVEETSSFVSSNEIWGEFLDRSTASADGWITQYFGFTPDELEANGDFLSLFQKYILDFWLEKQTELTAAAL